MRIARSLLALVGAVVTGLAVAATPASAELSTMMRLAAVGAGDFVNSGTAPAGVDLVARVDISDQAMYVYLGEVLVHVFPVSTGRAGYGTPPGSYQAQWLAASWRSRKYNNAPMPWAVFFKGGYAIHGTTEVRRLGTPASHGCVRLHPANAKIFFQLVQQSGLDSTMIAIVR
jgi:hypothetical protein